VVYAYEDIMTKIVLIAHNLRSIHNVGSLLRTAEGLGVDELIMTGYTPYPAETPDERLPHLAQKIDRQISKTALGAEKSQSWKHAAEINPVIESLRSQGFTIVALEQTPSSQLLPEFKPPEQIALIVGREVEGLEPEVIELCDMALEIPMSGKKESFNVVQAAAMALYHCRFVLGS
jgi:23S rRNA (guanosine2251-2'-O)-methyltransferase